MEFRRRIPPTTAAAEELCQEYRRWSDSLGLKAGFAVELLLREALANAVANGANGAEGATEVTCIVRWRQPRLTIAVRDEGPGFDWRRQLAREMDVEAESGRGLVLYRLYAKRFRFNEAGNVVILQFGLKGAQA